MERFGAALVSPHGWVQAPPHAMVGFSSHGTFQGWGNAAPTLSWCFSSRPSGRGARTDRGPCFWSTVTATALAWAARTAARPTSGPRQVGWDPEGLPGGCVPLPWPPSVSPVSPDLQDMSVMLLRTQGPSAVFAEYPVVLHVPESDADKVRVFHAVREFLCPPLSQTSLRDPKVSQPRRFCSSGHPFFE